MRQFSSLRSDSFRRTLNIDYSKDYYRDFNRELTSLVPSSARTSLDTFASLGVLLRNSIFIQERDWLDSHCNDPVTCPVTDLVVPNVDYTPATLGKLETYTGDNHWLHALAHHNLSAIQRYADWLADGDT